MCWPRLAATGCCIGWRLAAPVWIARRLLHAIVYHLSLLIWARQVAAAHPLAPLIPLGSMACSWGQWRWELPPPHKSAAAAARVSASRAALQHLVVQGCGRTSDRWAQLAMTTPPYLWMLPFSIATCTYTSSAVLVSTWKLASLEINAICLGFCRSPARHFKPGSRAANLPSMRRLPTLMPQCLCLLAPAAFRTAGTAPCTAIRCLWTAAPKQLPPEGDSGYGGGGGGGGYGGISPAQDTIFALSSGADRSAVAVIRISGPNAGGSIAQQLLSYHWPLCIPAISVALLQTVPCGVWRLGQSHSHVLRH